MVRVGGLRARVLNEGIVDMLMMATAGGMEVRLHACLAYAQPNNVPHTVLAGQRDAAQWTALLSEAGFQIMKIWPTRCPLSIIQAVATPEPVAAQVGIATLAWGHLCCCSLQAGLTVCIVQGLQQPLLEGSASGQS